MFTHDLHAYVRALMGADAVRSGPFLVGLDEHDDGLFRNYAVPDDGASPSETEVGDLIEVFRSRSRTPRLEYLPDLAPDLEATLIAHGFVAERHLPVLTCPPDEVLEPSAPGVRVRRADDVDLPAVADAQNEAYGVATTTEHDVQRLRSTVERGGLVVLAEPESDPGNVVGAGLCAPPHHGVSELAAVGVRAAYRRRGIAAAVTAHLTRWAGTVGIEYAFLTPAGPDEERIYRRVGYRDAATMLHTSVPRG